MSYYFNPHGHQCPWYPYSELLGYPSANWCEEVSCYILSEPINTSTALVFVIVAALLSPLRFKKDHPDIKQFYNVFLISGIFIAFYHMTNTYLAQIMAHGIIVFFFTLGIIKNLIRMGKINYSSKKASIITIMGFFLLFEMALYKKFMFPQMLIPIFYLGALVTEYLARKKEQIKTPCKFLIIGFGLLIIGEVFSYLDVLRIFCDPKSFIQGHSIWHLFAASSMGLFLYHYYLIYPLKVSNKDQEIEEKLESLEVERVEIKTVEEDLMTESEANELAANEAELDSPINDDQTKEINLNEFEQTGPIANEETKPEPVSEANEKPEVKEDLDILTNEVQAEEVEEDTDQIHFDFIDGTVNNTPEDDDKDK